MPRVLGGSWGGKRLLMSEVLLQAGGGGVGARGGVKETDPPREGTWGFGLEVSGS